MEYYEEGALVRGPETSHLLPSMAAGTIHIFIKIILFIHFHRLLNRNSNKQNIYFQVYQQYCLRYQLTDQS